MDTLKNLSLISSGMTAFYRLLTVCQLAVDSCIFDTVERDRRQDITRKVISNLPAKQFNALASAAQQVGEEIDKNVALANAFNRGDIHEVPPDKVMSIEDFDAGNAFKIIFEHSLLISTHDISRRTFLAETALVSLMSAFEVFCTELLAEVYKYEPRAIPGTPMISVRDLLEYDTSGQAINSVAEERARDQVRGPVDSWITSLAPHCDMQISRKLTDWDETLRNICTAGLMRNAIVHAGGRVDEELRSRLNSIGSPLPTNKNRLNLTRVDVESVAHSILSVTSEMLLGVSRKYCKKDEVELSFDWMTTFLATHRLELYELGRPEMGRAIRYSKSRQPSKASHLHDGLLLGWTSDALLDPPGRIEEIRSFIETEDLSPRAKWDYVFLASIAARDDDVEATAKLIVNEKLISYIDLLANVKLALLRSRLSTQALQSLRPDWLKIM